MTRKNMYDDAIQILDACNWRSADIDAWLPKDFIESWETAEMFGLLNDDENVYLEAYAIATKKNRSLKFQATMLRNWVYTSTNIWEQLKMQEKAAKKSAIDWVRIVQYLGDE